jgi:hypothetical protein
VTTGINLGLMPEALRVILSDGADFLCTLQLDDDWPVGTALSLTFDSGITAWTATIGGTDAVFSVDKAVTDLVPDGTAAKLVYTNGSTDQVWAVGTVVRK